MSDLLDSKAVAYIESEHLDIDQFATQNGLTFEHDTKRADGRRWCQSHAQWEYPEMLTNRRRLGPANVKHQGRVTKVL